MKFKTRSEFLTPKERKQGKVHLLIITMDLVLSGFIVKNTTGYENTVILFFLSVVLYCWLSTILLNRKVKLRQDRWVDSLSNLDLQTLLNAPLLTCDEKSYLLSQARLRKQDKQNEK